MSPDIIGVFIPIVALLIPIFALYFRFKREQVRRQERMLATEKGVELPTEPVAPVKTPLKPTDYLRRGLLAIAVGIGLWVSSIFMPGIEEGGWIGMGGLIVFLVGVALLIYYAVQKRAEQ